jgi:hypothetical protein
LANDDLVNTIATGDTIDDFLVSLASGVADAQQKLHDLSQSAGSGIMYQIPQLEFELKLQISTVQQSGGRPTPGFLQPRQIMRVSTPLSKDETTAASTIKGTLVAVPINSGKPRYLLDMIFSETEQNDRLDVVVSVTDVTGSPQQGVDVELNIDRDSSYQLNKDQGIDKPLQTATQLLEGVVTTDSQGSATGQLQLDAKETAGMIVVITADALGESKALNYRIS